MQDQEPERSCEQPTSSEPEASKSKKWVMWIGGAILAVLYWNGYQERLQGMSPDERCRYQWSTFSDPQQCLAHRAAERLSGKPAYSFPE